MTRAAMAPAAVLLPWRWWLLGCLLLLAGARSALAAPDFYLVTFGPGPEVWERFGHNALWLVDQASGEEALYNFGFFDFEQRGFFKNFLLGRMRYYAAATDPQQEFPYYRRRGRSIEYQPLNLTAQQARDLAQLLHSSVLPQNREYLYDYFLANCSTRVRDAIDLALSGGVQQHTRAEPMGTSFRLSSLVLVQDNFLLYLGMQLGLGRVSDQPINAWQSFYLPYQLRDQLGQVEINGVPIAGEPYRVATGFALQRELHVPYWRFIVLGVISSLLLWLPWRLWRRQYPGRALIMCRLWWLVSGLAGAMLCFLWFATDHSAAWRNENTLLLCPVALPLSIWLRHTISRWLLMVVAAALLTALALKFLPAAQFNYDLLLWLVPVQLTALILSFFAINMNRQRPA